MGVKNFFKIPTNDGTIDSIGENIALESLKGHRIAIDASDFIYNSLLAMANVSALTDKEGNPTAHVLRIYQLALKLHSSGIKQIWVFDSPHPNKFKRFEAEKRRKQRQIGKDAGLEKQAFVMTGKHVDDIKKLLTYMGITYIEAPEGIEAEHYGAFMTSGEIGARFCTYMLSADSDVLMFGGNLLRHTTEKSASGKSKKTVYKVYELSEVMSALNVDREQLLKVAVCLGTDFQKDKVKGIGPKTVVHKVKALAVEITSDLYEVIEYFGSDPPAVGADVHDNVFDENSLREYLLNLRFAEDKINKGVATLNIS